MTKPMSHTPFRPNLWQVASVVTLSCALVTAVATPGEAADPSQPTSSAATTLHPPTGIEVAEHVNARNSNQTVTHRVEYRLIDAWGRVRERDLTIFRTFVSDATHLAIYVTAPPDWKRHALLVYDYFDPEHPDDQWIYEPRKGVAQRIPDSRRSRGFLGGDFTLEDVKKVFRIDIGQYSWKWLREDELDGRRVHVVEQVPTAPGLARKIGVSRVTNYVDAQSWVRVRLEFDDLEGNPVRVIENEGKRVEARNVQSGHRTEIIFVRSKIGDVPTPEVFTVRGMERELVN